MAHTGALAGSIETFDAISTREGVIRVRGLDELIETTECFVHADPPKGDRLAAVTLSGGKRGLLIDAFHSAGLNFAPLGPGATDKLAKMLGPGSIVGNPLDAGFAAVVDPSVYMQSIQTMIDDPDTDIVIIDSELPKAAARIARTQSADRQRKGRQRQQARDLYQHDVDRLHRLHQGVAQVAAAYRGHAGARPGGGRDQGLDRLCLAAQGSAGCRVELERIGARDAGADAQERQGRRARRGRVQEAAEGLRHSGLAGRRSRRPRPSAVRIARKIGFPVVAKVVSADILHKSDIGGVVLNLNSAAEVRKAFNDITARVRKLKSKPKLEGILIAQQVKADLELVVGASLDAEMGPVVLFGTGGVDIELMKDVALAGAPLDAAEARALIDRTKAGVKLKGYRGKPALHEASAVKALVGLSNLMADAGTRIASIDVNPFLINTRTGVAVDGLIVLNNAAPTDRARRRIDGQPSKPA